VGRYPVAVLVDFGCARRLDLPTLVAELRPEAWSSEQLWGNPLHAAPELQLEHIRVRHSGGNARFDFSKQPVFELGVLAYEICAGEHPVASYPAVLECAEADLRHLPEDYPADFAVLCRRMVRRELTLVRPCACAPPPLSSTGCSHLFTCCRTGFAVAEKVIAVVSAPCLCWFLACMWHVPPGLSGPCEAY
jgi:hypothetical protein